jgi:serine/threonine protein kinase/tetratricopeptide (TPR) repeat protein
VNDELRALLAKAVLDGDRVDWNALESDIDPQASRAIEHFKTLTALADVHRASVTAVSEPAANGAVATHRHWGHFRLLERVGSGAFGAVYRAWDERLDREVALKLLPGDRASARDSRRGIIHEGRLLARVRHPNVVTVYGAEQIGDRIGVWMEFIRGRTLEDLVRTGKFFSASETVAMGVQIAQALAAVHAAGLLHRDVKAHNVMFSDDGRIVLMDFGVGRELDVVGSTDVAGTPLYLAPEIFRGEPATVRTDIYSLGVLLYHLVTGSYPVVGHTVRELRLAHEQHQRGELRAARPDLPRGVARVIERATDAQPEGRYESVDALARDLMALQRHSGMVGLRNGLAAAALLLITLFALVVRPHVPRDDRNPGSRLASLIAGAPSPLERPAIAVLPLKNLGSDPGSDILVDSITAGLIRQLAIIDGLQVRSQTSSFMLRDQPRDLTDIGKRLGVNLVVEGDAQLSAGTLVIHAALVSVMDGASLWSDTIDRRIGSEGDVVAVTEDLTRTIVNRLRLKLGRTQRRYDTDIATVQTYLRARALRDARGARSRAAIQLFEEVIRKDPSFAPAQAALAATYGDLTLTYPNADGFSIPLDAAAARMEPLTRRALEIDPMLAEAHAAMGFIHTFALRWVDAEASFRRAIDLEPSLTAVYGDFVFSTLLPWGRLDDALNTLETALRADPLSLDVRRLLARVQLNAGRYDDALDNCRRVLEVDPDFPFADQSCIWALFFKGDRAEALDRLEKFSVGRDGVKGWLYAIAGRRAEAEEIAVRFAHLPQRQAEIYGHLGDTTRALEALERLALLNPSRAGFYLTYPELSALRGDPRVAEFRRKLGFPQH